MSALVWEKPKRCLYGAMPFSTVAWPPNWHLVMLEHEVGRDDLSAER